MSCEPEGDGAQDEAAAVDQGEFVVAAGQGPPLLGPTEGALDDVALLVVLGVEARGSPAARAAILAVGDLVRRLGNDRGDTAGTQQGAGATRGVRLVPRSALGVLRGRPAPRRGTRNSASNLGSAGL